MSSGRKSVKFGVKYGKFILVYERVVENLKPVGQIKEYNKQVTRKSIDTYA